MSSEAFDRDHTTGRIIDYYKVLGVARHATEKEIRTAFRMASLTCHPDKAPNDAAAAEKFTKILKYKDVLTDEEQRRVYDIALNNSSRNHDSFDGRHQQQWQSHERHEGHATREAGPERSTGASYRTNTRPETTSFRRSSRERSPSYNGPQRQRSHHERHRAEHQPQNESYDDDLVDMMDNHHIGSGSAFGTFAYPSFARDLRARWTNSSRAAELHDKIRHILYLCDVIGAEARNVEFVFGSIERAAEDRVRNARRSHDRSLARELLKAMELLEKILLFTGHAYENSLQDLRFAQEMSGSRALPTLEKVKSQLRAIKPLWVQTRKDVNRVALDLTGRNTSLERCIGDINGNIRTWQEKLVLPERLSRRRN